MPCEGIISQAPLFLLLWRGQHNRSRKTVSFSLFPPSLLTPTLIAGFGHFGFFSLLLFAKTFSPLSFSECFSEARKRSQRKEFGISSHLLLISRIVRRIKNAGRKQKEGGGEEIVESFATFSEYLDQHESSSRNLKCAVGWAAARHFFF